MGRTYAQDRQWADTFLPQIKQIVGPHLLIETPHEIDCKQAADLMVLTARNVTIAARVRHFGFLQKYRNEFTIRAKRDTGAVTELSKIIDRWGDLMFYGHANAAETAIDVWWLIDLHAFRAHLIRHRRRIRCGMKPNGDGTHFAWFDLRSFPPHPPILIASSHPLRLDEAERAQHELFREVRA